MAASIGRAFRVEALLPDCGVREEAVALLTRANEAATPLGARPLRVAIEALAARARVPHSDVDVDLGLR